MPYSRGPYALPSSLPVPARPVLHSARKIDPQTRRYVMVAATGGFASMHSIPQRVYFLVCQVAPRSEFVTPDDLEGVRRRIVLALEVLTKAVPPAIELQAVTVTSGAMGQTDRLVKFQDLTTGQDQSVQV